MHIDFLLADFAPLCRATEPEVGLRRISFTGKQFFQTCMAAGGPTGEALQGPVAVEHAAVRVDNLQCAVKTIGDRLDHIRFGGSIAQAQEAGQQTEYQEHAGHRQQRQQAEHHGLGHGVGQQHKNDGSGQQHPQQRKCTAVSGHARIRCIGRRGLANLDVCHTVVFKLILREQQAKRAEALRARQGDG